MMIANAAAAQTTIDFRQAAAYPASERTTALAVADFNLDGDLDVAAASSMVSTVNIFLGDGHGGLTRVGDATTGGIPLGIAAGNYDEDNLPDLVLTQNESDAMWFLRNLGDGSFATARQLASGHDPWAVLATDVDLDGRLDIVQSLAAETGGRVNVFYGDGDGTFSAPLGARTGGQNRAVAIADVNNDNLPDAIAANTSSSSISVLRARGDRTFAPQVESPVGSQPAGLVAGHFDEDGFVDVVTSAFGEDSIVFSKGMGSTSFGAPSFLDVGDAPLGVAAGDIDGDGRLDVTVANSRSRSVGLLRNDGESPFAATRAFIAADTPIAVVMADLNEDGLDDIISGSHGDATGIINVMLANGAGVDAAEQLSAPAPGTAIATGDLDGDQLSDVVMAMPSINAISVAFAAEPQQPLIITAAAVSAVAIVELDGDDWPDLIVAHDGSSELSLFRNAGGSFAAAVAIPAGDVPRALAAGDYDADGRLDLAVAYQGSSEVALLRGSGDGSFATAIKVGLQNSAIALTNGDYDRDGALDVAVLTSGPAIEILLGSASGFASAGRRTIATAAVDLTSLAADNGSNLDVAVAYESGTIQLFLGDGNGGLAPGATIKTVELPSSIHARDVSGDGRADLIVAERGRDAVAMIAVDGNGGLLAPYLLEVSPAPRAALAADLDGDGGYDVFTSCNLPTIAINRRSAAARGEVNRDGRRSAADVVAAIANLRGALPRSAELAPSTGTDADGDGLISSGDVRAAALQLF
ncbi:MAG TPA: VCBS repeat-containing protein [Terriglobales bacterium]|nr:VCBS repeat-containing protein [Terriglobales bacterium]